MTTENESTIEIDDAGNPVESNDGQPKKSRRGRKPGSKNGGNVQTGKKEKLSARQLTGLLFLSHAGAAEALNVPEIALDEREAESLANAIVDVMQYYDFEASAKTVAWANLIGTAAAVYGLKFLSLRKKGGQNDNTAI